MGKKFTAKFIENVRPGAVRREIPDSGCSGLYLLLQPSGHRSWAVRYRFDGVPTKLTLGPWPAVSLLDARVAATKAREQVAKGLDPAAAKTAAARKAAEAQADTLAAIAAAYMKREGVRLRTADQRQSILDRLILPQLGGRPIEEIRRSEIVHLLDKVEDHNGQRMADATLAVLRKIMAWHATRSDDFVPPIVRGMGRQNVAEHRRSRILDDGELRAVWTAATATEGPFGALVRLALLTSARRGEIAAMKWGEVDAEGVWTLPASRSKTKSAIVRPLSKAAQAILAEQPRVADCDYIFTSNGRSPIKSFSGPKVKLDTAAGVHNDWRLHDLRRTARSLLSRAGVNADVAERCLGHAMPTIRATYDRHQYLSEMAHAFEALGALIERIVEPSADNVLPLRSA